MSVCFDGTGNEDIYIESNMWAVSGQEILLIAVYETAIVWILAFSSFYNNAAFVSIIVNQIYLVIKTINN